MEPFLAQLGSETRIFLGVPGLSDAAYVVKRSEVRTDVTFPNSICSMFGAWGRGVGTTGYREEQGRSFGEGICEIVPGTLTNTSATLRTWIYEVWGINGQYLGYFPTTPANVVFQYTVLGVPTPNIINGDNIVCGTSNPFTIPDLPTGATVQWQVSPALVTVNTPNSTQTTLTKTNNGNITLTATINNTCGAPITLTKSLYIGVPTIYGTYTDHSGLHFLQYWTGSSSSYNSVCNSYTAQTTMDIQGSSGVTWSKVTSNPSTITWSQNLNDISFYFWQVNQTAVFEVDASNTCGTTINTFGFKSIDCSGGGGGCLVYQLSPNPATSSIQVGITPNLPAPCGPQPLAQTTTSSSATTLSKNTSKIERSIQSITIYDNGGQIKQQYTYGQNNKHTILNVSNLPSGIYIIHITDGTYAEDHRVVISK